MHIKLQELLEKLGIRDIEDLSKEEKKEFDRISGDLSKEELTMEDVLNFCKSQVSIIEARWKNLDKEPSPRLIPMHAVYSSIVDLIESPRKRREDTERYLASLIDNTD